MHVTGCRLGAEEPEPAGRSALGNVLQHDVCARQGSGCGKVHASTCASSGDRGEHTHINISVIPRNISIAPTNIHVHMSGWLLQLQLLKLLPPPPPHIHTHTLTSYTYMSMHSGRH